MDFEGLGWELFSFMQYCLQSRCWIHCGGARDAKSLLRIADQRRRRSLQSLVTCDVASIAVDVDFWLVVRLYGDTRLGAR